MARIALCLSGHLRMFRETEAFWRPLINRCDVYISTWNTVDKSNEVIDEEEIRSFYNPVKLVIEPFEEAQARFRHMAEPYLAWLNTLDASFRTQYNIVNTISMYYKFWHCQSLVQKEYQLVIRSRSDVVLSFIPLLFFRARPNKLNTMILPGERRERFLNDLCFSADSETMNVVCDLYAHIPHIYQQAQEHDDPLRLFNPHTLLYEYLQQKGVGPIKWTIPHHIHTKHTVQPIDPLSIQSPVRPILDEAKREYIYSHSYPDWRGVRMVGKLETADSRSSEYLSCANWLMGQTSSHGFIEIGSAWGVSFHLWASIITTGPKISVDLPLIFTAELTEELYAQRLKKWQSHFSDVHSIIGDSRLTTTVEQVEHILNGAQVGFLFIDGDHHYDAVKSDYEKYKKFVRPGGFIAFHDICCPTEPDVGRFWNEIKTSTSVEFLGEHVTGIGILKV